MTKKHPKPLVLTGALHAIQWIWGPPNYPPKSLLWIRQLKKCAWWPNGCTLPGCRGAGTFPPPKWAGDWFDLPKHSCGAILSLCFLVKLVPGTGVGSKLQRNNYILPSLSLSLDVVVCLIMAAMIMMMDTLSFHNFKNHSHFHNFKIWSLIDRCPDCVHLFSIRATLFKVITGEPHFEWLSWRGRKGASSIGKWYLLQIHQPDSWARNL